MRFQGVDGAVLTAPEAIEQLLSAQIQLRNNRRLQAAMRSSRLPAVKRLTEFDFSFQPSLRREQRWKVCTSWPRLTEARPLADLSDFQPAEVSDFGPALTMPDINDVGDSEGKAAWLLNTFATYIRTCGTDVDAVGLQVAIWESI
jgi:hypothetical protein